MSKLEKSAADELIKDDGLPLLIFRFMVRTSKALVNSAA